MIVHETADTRLDRARLWNLMLDGNEDYEQDRVVLDKLQSIAPDVTRLAINEAEFIERAYRYVIGLRGINQVVYCGAPLPPNQPPHAAAWEAIALRLLQRVIYLEPNRLLAAKGAGYLADQIATVLCADPLDLAASVERIGGEIEWDQPVAVVAPGMLHWLGDDTVREWMWQLAAQVAPGSYLIASHFLDPETDSAVVLVERLIQAFDRSLGVSHFRRQAEIEQLFTSDWDLVKPGVIPAQGWWPGGPQMRMETPCDRMMAGVVATIRRSP